MAGIQLFYRRGTQMNHFLNQKSKSVLWGVLLGLLLPLSAPPRVSALTVSGCGELLPGGTVNCGVTTIFKVVGGFLTTDPFADLSVAITWLDVGDTLPGVTDVNGSPPINSAGDFVYQYQIQDVFIESVSDINFTFLFGGAVVQSGYIEDAGASPLFLLYPDPILPGIDPNGNFSATYDPSLLPGDTSLLPADTLIVRSYTTPGLNTLSMTGDFTASTIGAALVIGPGQGDLSGITPTPEPSTLLLLGSGLLALAGWFRKI